MDHNGFNSLYIRELANNICENSPSKDNSIKKLIAASLVKDRERRKNNKRCMSVHVCSRWYRAPEISLIERQYD